jgi:hypothetical protein
MTEKANRSAEGQCAGYPAGDRLLCEKDDDFDALLAASSFGSGQARAIREQAPAAAREHARRVLDGQEKCSPADDAADGLAYGFARAK